MKFLALASIACLFSLPNLALAQNATDLTCSQCVGSSDIANDSVGSAKIKDGSVASSDIAANGVKSVNINNSAVTFNKLAPGLREQVEKSLRYVWFEVIADIQEFTAGVQCPAESYPVSASCACDDEDGFRNFGVLFNCEIVGPGVTTGCFVDGATFDPELGNPAARVHAYCMAALRSDGTRWTPFPEALPPVSLDSADAASSGEAEWHQAQFVAYQAALIQVRKTAAARNNRLLKR
jgi:hypothetical protein